MPPAILRLFLSVSPAPRHPFFLIGRDLAEYSMKNVTERVYPFLAVAKKGSIRDVQEKLRYFDSVYDTELKPTAEIDKEKTYLLPDHCRR